MSGAEIALDPPLSERLAARASPKRDPVTVYRVDGGMGRPARALGLGMLRPDEVDVEDPKPPPAAEGKPEAAALQGASGTASPDGAEDEKGAASSESAAESGRRRPPWRGLRLRVSELLAHASEWMSLSLRSRCLLWMGFLVVVLVGTTAAIAITVFPESFQHIEKDHMEENVRRFAIALQTDLLTSWQKLVSYAQWDETRTLILRAAQDPSDPYVESYMAANLPPNLFESLEIEYALFYDAEGRLVAKTTRGGLRVPRDLRSIARGGPLWGREQGRKWAGAGFFSAGADEDLDAVAAPAGHTAEEHDEDVTRVFIVVAANVYGSEAVGEAAGTAVFARRLSGEELEALAVRTQLCATVSALPFADPEPPDMEEAARSPGSPYRASARWPWQGGSRPRLRFLAPGYLDVGGPGHDTTRRCYGEDGESSETSDRVAAYVTLESLFPGGGHILLRLDKRRDLVATGVAATRVMFLALLVIGAAFFAAMLLFLEVMVLRALSSLTGQIRRIAETDDTSARIAKPRFHACDEIGVLAEALNVTLSVIQRSREAVARADEDARELLYSACPRPLAERLLGGEALVAGPRVIGTAVCLRIVSTHPEHTDWRGCAAGLVLPRGGQGPAAAEVLPGQLEHNSYVHVWNTVLLSLDRLCAERGLDGFSLAGGDTLMAVTGLPKWSEDHAQQAVQLAQDAAELVERLAAFFSIPVAAKVGVASGWMVSGVLRRPALKRYQFNVWGGPIEEAARLAAAAHAGRVAVSVEGDARAAAASVAAEQFLFGVPESPRSPGAEPPEPPAAVPGAGGAETPRGGAEPPTPRPQPSIRPPFRARRSRLQDYDALSASGPGPSASLRGFGDDPAASPASPFGGSFVELQRRGGPSKRLDRLLPGGEPALPEGGAWGARPICMPSLADEADAAAAAGGALLVSRRRSVRVEARGAFRWQRQASGSRPPSAHGPATPLARSFRGPRSPSRASDREAEADGAGVPAAMFVVRPKRSGQGELEGGIGLFDALAVASLPPSPRASHVLPIAPSGFPAAFDKAIAGSPPRPAAWRDSPPRSRPGSKS